MKRTQSQVQPAISDPCEEAAQREHSARREHGAHWENVRHPKQRFECLKCEPHHITTVFGFGDDMVWPHSPDFDA